MGKWLVHDVDETLLAAYRNDFCYKTALGEGHPTQEVFNPSLDSMIEVYEQPDTAHACNAIC